MRQALHIFKKDAWHLRWEIGIVLLLAFLLGWTERGSGLWLAEALFSLAASVLIARAVHAEAIPGDNQFWITRPYRWGSLLGAKLGFVLLFVSLPMMVVQFFLAWKAGFPVTTFLSGLLWSQMLVLCCAVLPVAALASMTSSLGAFFSVSMVPLILGLVFNSGLLLFFGSWGPEANEGFGAVEWVRSSVAVVGASLISAVVIYCQYNGRRTAFTRQFAIWGSAVFVTAYFLLPWTSALRFQSALSARPFDASALQVKVDAVKIVPYPYKLREGRKGVGIALPFSVSGIPDGLDGRADAVWVRIQAAGRRPSEAHIGGLIPKIDSSGDSAFAPHLLLDPELFQNERVLHADIHVRLFLTLLGEAENISVPVQASALNAIDGLRCGIDFLGEFSCRSAFRWPARAVYASFKPGGSEPFTAIFSYSPFPAEMAFNPIESHWVSRPVGSSKATIIAKKALSHFERDFEIRNVRLEKLPTIQ
jgi:hypothetical protein